MHPERTESRSARRALWGALLALVLAVSIAASAFAGAGTVSLKAVTNASVGKAIVVNPTGRSLYELSPETAHHLLCKSAECLHFWPPLTVPSRATKLKAAGGVQGKLGLLRRSNGKLQVTLRGLPLYRYTGDQKAGEASGEGIKSFGGTWHAMPASATASTPSAPAAPTPSPPSEPYGY